MHYALLAYAPAGSPEDSDRGSPPRPIPDALAALLDGPDVTGWPGCTPTGRPRRCATTTGGCC